MVNRVTTKLNDGTYGLFISKPGFDVLTADPIDLTFDSREDYLGAIHQTGTATRGQTVTFPSLGYIPMVFVTIRTGSVTAESFTYRANPVTMYNTYNQAQDTGMLYYPKQLVEPIYKVTTTQLTFVSDYTSQFDPSGGYTASYTILKTPGAS
jgi:hypothetical protein